MRQHLFKLLLLSLLCPAWPGRVGAEALGRPAVCLSNTAAKEQNANAPKATAQYWNKPTGPTKFEKTMSMLFISLLFISTVGLIAGLIDGHNVFVAVLLIGVSTLGLFIMSRILKARKKKNKGKAPTAPAKK